MSWRVSEPVTRATCAAGPRARRHRAPVAAHSAAVNQTSDASGDQASPYAVAKTGEIVVFFPGEVHDRNRAAVVVESGMVQERDPVALRRDARVPDPARRLEEHLAGRETPGGAGRCSARTIGELLPVGRPVGELDVLEQLARCAPPVAPRARAFRPARTRRETALRSDGDVARRGTASRSAPGSPNARDSGVSGRLTKISTGCPSQAAVVRTTFRRSRNAPTRSRPVSKRELVVGRRRGDALATCA